MNDQWIQLELKIKYFFRTVFSRTNVLFSQHITVSQNVIRTTGAEREFSALSRLSGPSLCAFDAVKYLNVPKITQSILPIQPTIECVPNRTVTRFSSKGKRGTVRPAINRFFRLHWGGWIRTKCGRHKKMWKKSANQKHRLRQHVLVNAQQSYLLDKMVTKFWKRPKHYIDDIYEPYHERTYLLGNNCHQFPTKSFQL